MKKIIHFIFILFCLLLQTNLFANTIIVKGYVKDADNKAVANKTVKIYTDSSNQSCVLSHTSVTNPNGYYIDTLACDGDIRKLKIMIEDCNGSFLINEPLVSATSNIVESNFTICVTPLTPPAANCKAAFSYISTTAGIKFNGAGSQPPSGDSIISRTWVFGDSTETLTGNRIDPTHAYTKPGSYNVCLSIKTQKGCQSKYCETVVFTPGSNDCKVEIKVTAEKIGEKKFRFISSLSNTLLGDSIVQRTWKFGDGSSLDGNQVYPTKEYKDTGVYNVCIQVRTNKGCEKLYCFTVAVRDSVPGIQPRPANCKAFFTYTRKDSTITFNSAGSIATSLEDSITSRTWYYIDSTKGANAVSLSGNIISPSYTYSKPGKYPVYLVIKTKKGCESKYSAYVVIPSTPGECYVQIHVSTEKNYADTKKVRFTSNLSLAGQGDSIIQRSWKFGDNTSLDGNEISPLKEYKDTGIYTVCIQVKTAKGCQKEYCFSVIIRDSISPPSASCKAAFTYAPTTQPAGVSAGSAFKFNASGSFTPVGDSIISRTWIFDDSTEVLAGNRVDPSHVFTKAGMYTICLIIKTKKGCESKYCSTIAIRPILTTCKAVFTYTIKDSVIRFNSEGSLASSADDSIISRTWYYMDNTTAVSLAGNVINPSYTYSKPGSYTVYLVIKTKNGCESKYAGAVIIAPKPVLVNCKALFTYTIQNTSVKFNSAASTATSNDDSIISRIWVFGDNTEKLSGNNTDPSHTYANAGTYHAYLFIKTQKGCESNYSVSVLITGINCTAEVQFSAERTGFKKIQFNSSKSGTQSADSIIQRRWKFGDGTGLEGNVISPLKEFPQQGVYNTCLQIKTAKGCETQLCKQVVVQDSLGLAPTLIDYVKIIILNPNPVITHMQATIWSRNNNVEAEISIYDIYGTAKGTIKKLLAQGNNIIEIATASLYHGHYFLKVSSRNGKDTKAFYKL